MSSVVPTYRLTNTLRNSFAIWVVLKLFRSGKVWNSFDVHELCLSDTADGWMLIKNGHIGFALSVVKSEKLNHAKLLWTQKEPPRFIRTSAPSDKPFTSQHIWPTVWSQEGQSTTTPTHSHQDFIYLWILFSEAEKTPLEETVSQILGLSFQ